MLPIMRQIITADKGRYYTNGKENVPWVVGIKNGDIATATKEAGYLNLGVNQTAGTVHVSYVTDRLIDLTKIRLLSIEWEVAIAGTARIALIASGTKDGAIGVYDARLMISATGVRQVQTLNVESLVGNYYIRVNGYASNTSSYAATAKIYRIWGIK